MIRLSTLTGCANAAGADDFYNFMGTTHIVVDVFGYFTNATGILSTNSNDGTATWRHPGPSTARHNQQSTRPRTRPAALMAAGQNSGRASNCHRAGPSILGARRGYRRHRAAVLHHIGLLAGTRANEAPAPPGRKTLPAPKTDVRT
jgi:hypothetical protein